jgi:hypothetical protein
VLEGAASQPAAAGPEPARARDGRLADQVAAALAAGLGR